MAPPPLTLPPGVTVRARPLTDVNVGAVLTPDALAFLAGLARAYTPRVQELLARRVAVQAAFDAGARPTFLPHTAHVRAGAWKVAPVPADLADRRVEITGPVDAKVVRHHEAGAWRQSERGEALLCLPPSRAPRPPRPHHASGAPLSPSLSPLSLLPQMVINALNSGARVFMADFEDSTSPTWAALIKGQANLAAAVRRTLAFTDPKTGKAYALSPRPATLFVRPRGWHLPEAHVAVDGTPIPGALFDFGLFFFHNARELVARGSGPYFYLPKLQSHLEARLWNEVFLHAQHAVGLPPGTIKATVLIETLPAAFEMEEILFELRDHSAGLNCGRWDYIFSLIKTLRADPAAVVPDRGVVTMTQPCMRAYSHLLIKTCHARGAHAMGGMAAQIPIKGDPAANEAALAKVKADKEREVADGHDGTWVAHPALVPIARAAFDAGMPGPNQLGVARADVNVTAADLLAVPVGPRTRATLLTNCEVGVAYAAAWLGGLGCVPLHHLMEDAATAEICRVQAWQWLAHGVTVDGVGKLDRDTFLALFGEAMARLRGSVGAEAWATGHYAEAALIFRRLVTAPVLADFLTLPLYEITAESDGAPPAVARM